MVHLKVCCRLICGVYWVSPETGFSKMYKSSNNLTKKRNQKSETLLTKPDDTVISCLRNASKVWCYVEVAVAMRVVMCILPVGRPGL